METAARILTPEARFKAVPFYYAALRGTPVEGGRGFGQTGKREESAGRGPTFGRRAKPEG